MQHAIENLTSRPTLVFTAVETLCEEEDVDVRQHRTWHRPRVSCDHINVTYAIC